MEFDLSQAQKLLKESARTFFTRSCPTSRVRAVMETATAHDPELWSAIAEQGWVGMLLPESSGGLGMNLVDVCVIAEEMGYACVPGPFLSNLWASSLLQFAEAGESYLADLAEGKITATVALLEDSADWDPRSVRTSADRQGESVSLAGVKHFVGDAEAAEILLCVGRNQDGLVIAPIERGSEGVEITATNGIDATRKLYQVRLERATAPASQLILGERAEDALRRSMEVATVAVCADMVGMMQWTLEQAVGYAKTRQQFDKPIGSFQAVQHKCADILLLAESARSATYYAAWAWDVGDPQARQAISIAKAYCSDAAREAGNLGIQVHGGIGFTWEHDLHLYYKRAKANEILFGDATFHRERVAESTLDAPPVELPV